jgi:hypothetical protein
VSVGGHGGWEGGGWSDTRDFQCGEDCLNPSRKLNCTGNSGFGRKTNTSGVGGHSMGNDGPQCFCDGTGRQHHAVVSTSLHRAASCCIVLHRAASACIAMPVCMDAHACLVWMCNL